MDHRTAKNIVQELLNIANISVNGNSPYDIHVYNDAFYSRVLTDGALGLGETYMDGWWDCKQVDHFMEKILYANLEKKIKKSKRLLFKIIMKRVINFQTKAKALIVGQTHYDQGVTLFKNMLDSRMNYTCGYWKNATSLEEAQLAKLELTCQKLLLKPGMRMLDIGCGFGALAKYAAEHYGVSVVGVTISKDQCDYAKKSLQRFAC